MGYRNDSIAVSHDMVPLTSKRLFPFCTDPQKWQTSDFRVALQRKRSLFFRFWVRYMISWLWACSCPPFQQYLCSLVLAWSQVHVVEFVLLALLHKPCRWVSFDILQGIFAGILHDFFGPTTLTLQPLPFLGEKSKWNPQKSKGLFSLRKPLNPWKRKEKRKKDRESENDKARRNIKNNNKDVTVNANERLKKFREIIGAHFSWENSHQGTPALNIQQNLGKLSFLEGAKVLRGSPVPFSKV